MRKVKILTDSCGDLTGEILEKYDIDYVKMSTILDGKESPALLTWTEDEVHEFYGNMKNGKRYTTAQVSTEEFTNVFGKYLKEGYDIVYVGCATKQTGSVNTGNVVAKSLLEKEPEAKIFCIDSLNATGGEGLLAVEAAKMAQAGDDAQTIADHIIKIRKTVNEYATVNSLEYFKKAGRVSASSAFFGNLMGVKPILLADAVGNQAAFKKVKGRQNSLQELVNLMKDSIVEPEKQTIVLLHADCEKEEVESLKKMIEDAIPCKGVYVSYLGPIIGATTGPGCFGIFAFGKEVTYKSEE